VFLGKSRAEILAAEESFLRSLKVITE